MIDRDFIRYCYNKAIRHKRNRWDVVNLNEDQCVENIYAMLRDRTISQVNHTTRRYMISHPIKKETYLLYLFIQMVSYNNA